MQGSLRVERLTAGLLAVAVAVIAWNAWTLSSLQASLEAVEAASSRAESATSPDPSSGSPARPRVLPAMPAQPTAEAAVDFDDPEVRQQLAEVIAAERERKDRLDSQQRSQRFLEALTDKVEAFASANALPDATRADVLDELRYRTEAFQATKDDARTGGISWLEAREEFEAIREQSDQRLTGLLGREVFERLDTELWGDRDKRGF